MHPSSCTHIVAARGKGEVAGEDIPREDRTFRTDDTLLGVVVILHLCAKWFSKPQGEPSGVWTGHKNPEFRSAYEIHVTWE